MDSQDSESDAEELCPYPGKAKSIVWMYFGFRRDKGSRKLNMAKAVCKLCRKTYTNNGNTTNFRAHLLREHPDESNLTTDTEKTPPATNQTFATGGSATSDRTSPTTFKTRVDPLSEAIGNYLVNNNLPLSVVVNQSFRKMLSTIDPRCKIPSTANLTNVLRKKRETLRANIVKHVLHLDVAVTHESWTSLKNETFETVTGRYITKSWVLESKVLATVMVEESDTTECIERVLRDVYREWCLTEPVLVTDNRSVEVTAAQTLKWERVNSIGHIINAVVDVGLREISGLLEKGRSLVSFVNCRAEAQATLVEKQRILLADECHGQTLVMDDPRRWDSTLDMLCRINTQTLALHALATDQKYKAGLQGKLFTFAEQAMLNSIIAMLRTFKVAAILLSNETQPTLSMVLPSLIKLERATQVQGDDIAVVIKMKDAMCTTLKEMKTSAHTEHHTLACLLDPRTKLLSFVKDDVRDATRSQLVARALEQFLQTSEVKKEVFESTSRNDDKISEMNFAQLRPIPYDSGPRSDNESEAVDDQQTMEPVTKKIKTEPCDQWLDDIINTEENLSRSFMSPEELVSKEVDRYVEDEQQISQHDSAITWWSMKEAFYPNIARIARKYLAIPASSLPPERTFYLPGRMVFPERWQLPSEDAPLMIFLNKNVK